MKFGSTLSLCALSALLSTLSPSTSSAATWSADLNCDGSADVVDVVLAITQALGEPLSDILDQDSDGVPDACASAQAGMACGIGTMSNGAGTLCVVDPDVLDQAFIDGANSVDVTDNDAEVAAAAALEATAAATPNCDWDTEVWTGAGDGACVCAVNGAVRDCDDVCGGENTSCFGCDGIANSGKVKDECGICGGPGLNSAGCCENEVKDACGVCGGPGLNSAGCCENEVKDECGVCGGPGLNSAGCCGSVTDCQIELPYACVIESQQGNLTVYNLYVSFDGAQESVANVYNAQLTPSGGFQHSDVQGGNFAPQATLDIAGISNPEIDSFVTIGYEVGENAANNATTLDPNFIPSSGDTIPWNAGWFNINPDNAQTGAKVDGCAGTHSVHIAQLVRLDKECQKGEFEVTLFSTGGATPHKLSFDSCSQGSSGGDDECGDGTTSCYGCDGIANSGKVLDVCGVCDGPGLNSAGCCENEIKDECGVCGGSGLNSAGCCENEVKDECGVCGGPGLNSAGCCENEVKDECGVCGGSGLNSAGCCGTDTNCGIDYPNLCVVKSQSGDLTITNLYIGFETQQATLLNVFNSEFTPNDGFSHSDAGGGHFKPSYSLNIPGLCDSTVDSFVTIGYGVGAAASSNSTELDPNFLDNSGGQGDSIPNGAGWYNANPSGQQTGKQVAGCAGAHNVHIAQLVRNDTQCLKGELEVSYKLDDDIQFTLLSFDSCDEGGGGDDEPSLPKCAGDASAFDAGFGGCNTYVVGAENHKWCKSDVWQGLFATQVCAECLECSP